MTGSPPTILLATDGNPSDAMALRATADLATRGLGRVHVLTVLEPPRAPSTQSSSVRRAEATRLLEEQRARLESAVGHPVDGAHLKEGLVVDVTVAMATEVSADLVVLGDHGMGVMDRFRDHVAEAVAARSPVPVLLVRGPDAAWPPHRVVIGHNGSPEAAEAAIMGTWVAEVLDLPVVTAVVLPPDDESAMSLDEAVKTMPPPGTRWSTAVVAGERPSRVLTELCRGEAPAVLLCVGARGSGALRRNASASVSAELLRHARFPLLLVPPAVLRHHARWVVAAAHAGRRAPTD